MHLLKDGRVLVTGGETNGSAELYDPQTDTWQPLAATAQPRSGHTATLLIDGRVLIAGGAAADAPLDSIDIFDPITNAITRATAVLTTARAGHSAVSLPDGRILLIAGRGAEGPLASTELFNPEDDKIAAGPSLQTARSSQSATVLGDNRILVAGGSDGEKDLATAEMLDPEKLEFQTLPVSLNTARRSHLALLIPGNGGILLAGGISGDKSLGDTELYLPFENTFLKLGNLTLPRSGIAAAPLTEGVILATGGVNSDGPQAACGILIVPAIRFAKSPYRPDETAEASGTSFPAETTVRLSLDVITPFGLLLPSGKSRLITTSVTTGKAANPLLRIANFGAVPILQTAPTDAGRIARLTAVTSGGITAVANVAIKLPTTLTVTPPTVQYAGFTTTFLAQLTRPNSPVPLTGRLTYTIAKRPPSTSISDGTSNTVAFGESTAVSTVSENLNLTGTSFFLQNRVTNTPTDQLSLTANYVGDAAHDPASATAVYQAASRTPSLQLNTDTAQPQVGSPFNIIASLSAQAGSPSRNLTGNVGFLLSGFLIGTPQAVNSPAGNSPATITRSFTPLTLDRLVLSANYSGDPFFSDAGSKVVVVTPAKANSTLTLVNPSASFVCQQPLPITARLSFPPALGLTNRIVSVRFNFLDGSVSQVFTPTGTLIPDPQLPGVATATFPVSVPSIASSLSVSFSGDTLLNPSFSATVPLTMQPSPATVQFLNPPTAPVTGSTTLTVQVSSTSCDALPTGSIEFSESGAVLGVRPLAQDSNRTSTASLTVSRPVGTRTITARYSGDRAYQPGTAPAVSIVFQ